MKFVSDFFSLLLFFAIYLAGEQFPQQAHALATRYLSGVTRGGVIPEDQASILLAIAVAAIAWATGRNEDSRPAPAAAVPPAATPATDVGSPAGEPATAPTAVAATAATDVHPGAEEPTATLPPDPAAYTPPPQEPKGPSLFVPVAAVIVGLIGLSAVILSAFDVDVTVRGDTPQVHESATVLDPGEHRRLVGAGRTEERHHGDRHLDRPSGQGDAGGSASAYAAHHGDDLATESLRQAVGAGTQLLGRQVQ